MRCKRVFGLIGVNLLDKTKLLKEIDKQANNLFHDFTNENAIAYATWCQLIIDPDFKQPIFQEKIKNVSGDLLLPSWHGCIADTVKVDFNITDYQVIGVDGSQIYPDRHQGSSCFLLNTGSVVMRYGRESVAIFGSDPELFAGEETSEMDLSENYTQNSESNSNDYVDALRELKELIAGFELAKNHPFKSSMLMLDGSLIFWHLVSKPKAFRDKFFSRYIQVFEQLHLGNFLYCAYSSMPRNKELINLVKVKLSNFEIGNCASYNIIEDLTDMSIMQLFLPQFHRSIIFKNHASISQDYPVEISPYFFYINVVNEIARVEVPEFIALDEEKLNFTASVVLNQALKGVGYPIILAESHEQAVVKSHEKEFFYEILSKIGFEKRTGFVRSQKALKKRRMPC